MTVLWKTDRLPGILILKNHSHRKRQAGMNHQYKDLYIDTRTKRVFRQGQEVHLTCTEYRLLLVLLGNVGRVFSREELLRRVWGITVPVRTRTVDIHIARLRRKLGLREEIRAVMRRGYALHPLPPTQR